MTTLNDAVSLYNNMGCPATELETTLDCLTGMAMAGEITEGQGPLGKPAWLRRVCQGPDGCISETCCEVTNTHGLIEQLI